VTFAQWHFFQVAIIPTGSLTSSDNDDNDYRIEGTDVINTGGQGG